MAYGDTHIDISSKLTDPDWHCIDSFKYRSDRLAETALVGENNSGRVKWSLSMSAEGMSCEGTLPSEPVIVEHLAALRFFFLEKEPSFFNKVVNVISKHDRTDEATQDFRQIKADWKNALMKSVIWIEWQGGKTTAGTLLDLWFNGVYFHGDVEAKDELRRLWDVVSEPMAKWLLIEAALNSASVVLRLNKRLKNLVR